MYKKKQVLVLKHGAAIAEEAPEALTDCKTETSHYAEMACIIGDSML